MKIRKQNWQKVCHKKTWFEDYENCLEATQLENKKKTPRKK